MSQIKFVKQEEKYGCGIACLAMVAGETYANVRQWFVNDFAQKGINFDKAIAYLGDKGFQTIHKKVGFYNNVGFGRNEMLKPFAPVHIVRVQSCFDTPLTHVVVMDEKGKLICPQETPEDEIRACYCVTDVWGLYK